MKRLVGSLTIPTTRLSMARHEHRSRVGTWIPRRSEGRMGTKTQSTASVRRKFGRDWSMEVLLLATIRASP